MDALPDFIILSSGAISKLFLERGISTFKEATLFVAQLPYARNSNKLDLTTVFSEGCGTCGTKHALLKQLADEHQVTGIRLMTGMIKMNAVSMPAVAATLQKHGLEYIPEAHNYLRYGDSIYDFTKASSNPDRFADGLMDEADISPDQIGAYKVVYHRRFLERWLAQQPGIPYPLEQLWAIREQCIRDLSS